MAPQNGGCSFEDRERCMGKPESIHIGIPKCMRSAVSNGREVFHECDEGKKGYLSRDDIKVAVVMLFGYKPSKYDVDQIMKGVNGLGLSLEQFVSLMTTKLTAVDEDDEIRQTFMAFDTTCRGFLTLADVQKAFSTVAPHIPSHRVQKVFSEIDRDGDGRVSYRDFEYMMKYSTEEAMTQKEHDTNVGPTESMATTL